MIDVRSNVVSFQQVKRIEKIFKRESTDSTLKNTSDVNIIFVNYLQWEKLNKNGKCRKEGWGRFFGKKFKKNCDTFSYYQKVYLYVGFDSSIN